MYKALEKISDDKYKMRVSNHNDVYINKENYVNILNQELKIFEYQQKFEECAEIRDLLKKIK